MRRIQPLLGTMGIGAVLVLAACGGSSAGGSSSGGGSSPAAASPSSSPSAAAAGQTVAMDLQDFTLNPNAVTLNGPGTYTFHVTNSGAAPHALRVEGNGLPDTKTTTLQKGGSADLQVNLQSGNYEIDCPVDGHEQRGMKGTLTVK